VIAAGLGFAAAAACCYAVAATLQHDAVHTVTEGAGSLRLGQLGALALRRRWLLGLLAMCCGAGLHVVSLSLAPLLIVQPVGVLAIGLTALLAARSAKVPPTRTTVVAVLTTAAGVGLFLLVAAPHASAAAVPEMAAGRVLPVTGAVVAALVAAALTTRGWARCPLFATAAGVAYGTVSVLTRVVADRVRVGGLAGLPLGPTVGTVLGGVLAIVTGAVCVQQAYASGRPDTVLACQTVVDPLIGVLFGVCLFHEAVGATPAAVFGQVAGGALAVFGVLLLAHRRTEPVSNKTVSTSTGKQAMDRPLRIIIGADTYPPDINGAARFAHQLAAGLAGRGHDVHVLCPSDTGPAGVSTMDGVTVHRLAAHRTPAHPTFRVCLPWRTGGAARALLAELNPDVVHVQAHFMVGRALVRAAVERDIPVVATNHFMPENLFGYLKVPGWLRHSSARLAWRDLARVLRPARVVTAPTPTAVRLLHDQGFGGRAVAVSCGVDLDRFRSYDTAAAAGDGRTVLFVGRLDEEKRVHELLHALALLPDRLPLRVDVVGDGACRPALTALAERLGIADRVRFRGFVSPAELVDAYRECSAFCMPGVAELQSLATMEAMAAARPVVAADAVALPHLVQPGRNGWLYPPGDVTALADRLTTLFGTPGALVEMGAASRDLIRRHDVNASLDTFVSLYRGAIDGERRALDDARHIIDQVPLPMISPVVAIPATAVRP
jgi:glycosyltransferase involved in cell wall biosynthesis